MAERTWATYRTVVLDPRAEKFVAELGPNGNRFTEQWDGIEWLLARTPEIGVSRHSDQPSSFLLLAVGANEIAKTKDIWVLYSYSDGEVTIHDARFAEN